MALEDQEDSTSLGRTSEGANDLSPNFSCDRLLTSPVHTARNWLDHNSQAWVPNSYGRASL